MLHHLCRVSFMNLLYILPSIISLGSRTSTVNLQSAAIAIRTIDFFGVFFGFGNCCVDQHFDMFFRGKPMFHQLLPNMILLIVRFLFCFVCLRLTTQLSLKHQLLSDIPYLIKFLILMTSNST